jgi:hypothetical protein
MNAEAGPESRQTDRMMSVEGEEDAVKKLAASMNLQTFNIQESVG